MVKSVMPIAGTFAVIFDFPQVDYRKYELGLRETPWTLQITQIPLMELSLTDAAWPLISILGILVTLVSCWVVPLSLHRCSSDLPR